MNTCKIEGVENLHKDAEKQIIEDARRAGVAVKFSRDGKTECSGPEDSVRKFLKLNPSLQITEPDTSICKSDVGVIDPALEVSRGGL